MHCIDNNDSVGRVCIIEIELVAGLGFEPRPAGPEPAVLPLDDPAILFMTMLPITLLIWVSNVIIL